MYPGRLLRPLGLFLLCVVALLTVGCGAASTSVASNSAATPTATCPPIRTRGATGTLQSVSGNTLLLTNQQNKTIKVSYTSTTRFIRQSTAKTSVLTSGTFVTVAVTQNQDNTYTATKIMLGQRFGGNGNFGSGAGRGQGQQGGVNPACFAQRRGGNNGTFGNGTGSTGAGSTGARAIAGTVGQLNGNTLVVSSTTGDDFTVTLNTTTQILQSQTAAASDLKAGMGITVVGTADSQGTVAAQQITILLSTTKLG